MVSGNAPQTTDQTPQSASENTGPPRGRRRGRAAVDLSEPYTGILEGYVVALRLAPLSDQTRRTYTSKARQFLAWLAAGDAEGDPLNAKDARDWAVRDYRTHLQAVLKRKPATVNNALAAVDDLYIRRGLGPATVARAEVSRTAPKALSKRAGVRFLRAVEASPSPRDQALALVPFYAGARIGEVVGLDVDDVQLSARKGSLRVYGKGEKVREIPIHPQLRQALTGWLDERPDWPGAESPALFLNQRGQRLSVRGAHGIITGIAQRGGLDDDTTAHVYADPAVMPRLVGSRCSGQLERRGCRHIQRSSRNLRSVSGG